MIDRPDAHAQIIDRYRGVAHMPDGLFFFTFPLRRQAVRRLRLVPGGSVLEVGCGSGANFPYELDAVGPAGRIVGVDLSPDMIAAARARVRRRGWSRIELIESAAENLHLEGHFDALLLFAMHDVFTSAEGLDHCLAHVRPGGRVVAVGPALAAGRLGRVVNPILGAVFRRFAVSSLDRDQPWRLLAERIPELRVERSGPGVLFMAWREIR